MKIIDSIWFNNIGIVLGMDDVTKKMKAYIGIGEGKNKISDELHIASCGLPFPAKIAEELILGQGQNDEHDGRR